MPSLFLIHPPPLPARCDAAGPQSKRCPKGFTIQDTLSEPYVYTYYGPAFSYNCGPTVQLDSSQYSTDVIRNKAVKYIK